VPALTLRAELVTNNQNLQANRYAVKPLPPGYNAAEPGIISDLQFRNLVRRATPLTREGR